MDEFEEIAGELNNHSSKPGKIIFIILILLAFGSGIYFVISQIINSKNKKEEISIKEEKIQSTDFDCYDKCDYSFSLDGKDIKVEYQKIPKEEGQYTHILKINGVEVLNQGFECGGPVKLIVVKDTLLIQYRNDCLNPIDTLISYDQNGVQLFQYQNMDEEISDMKLHNALLTVEDNIITVRATRVKNKTELAVDGKYINLCDENELARNEITDDTIVEGSYNIEYKGQLKFSKPIRKKSISLAKYKSLNELENICSNT